MEHNANSIGNLIEAFFKKQGLEEKMEEVDINHNWTEIVGPVIAKHTKSIRLKDRKLILYLNSAALRHTLSFSKSELISKLNDSLGKELIDDVVLK